MIDDEIAQPARRSLNSEIGKSAKSEEEEASTFGHAKESFSNFTRLHNSTINIDGVALPSMSVRIEPDEPENVAYCSKHLSFEWEVLNFTPDELWLKLDFKRPECVSSTSSEGDFVVVDFNDQRLFKDSEDKLIWPQFTVKARIKR